MVTWHESVLRSLITSHHVKTRALEGQQIRKMTSPLKAGCHTLRFNYTEQKKIPCMWLRKMLAQLFCLACRSRLVSFAKNASVFSALHVEENEKENTSFSFLLLV